MFPSSLKGQFSVFVHVTKFLLFVRTHVKLKFKSSLSFLVNKHSTLLTEAQCAYPTQCFSCLIKHLLHSATKGWKFHREPITCQTLHTQCSSQWSSNIQVTKSKTRLWLERDFNNMGKTVNCGTKCSVGASKRVFQIRCITSKCWESFKFFSSIKMLATTQKQTGLKKCIQAVSQSSDGNVVKAPASSLCAVLLPISCSLKDALCLCH